MPLLADGRGSPRSIRLSLTLSLSLSRLGRPARAVRLFAEGALPLAAKRGFIFFQKKTAIHGTPVYRPCTPSTRPIIQETNKLASRRPREKHRAESEEGGGHVQVWYRSREASGVWGFIVAFGVVRGPASLRVVTSRAGPRRCSERRLRRRPSFVLYCPNTSADARVRGAEEEGIPQQEGHEGEPPFEEDQVQENVLVLRKVRRGFGSTPDLHWDIEGDVHLLELAQTRSRGGGELRRL